MSDMAERVARACFAHWRANCDLHGVHQDRPRNFDDMPEGERAFALTHARISIEAMREPTEAMVEVGRRELPLGLDAPDMAKKWRAMIDEALKKSA